MKYNLTGNLIVASSLVTDEVYSRAVCLIMHQDEDHVIGVMLNRPLEPLPQSLLDMLHVVTKSPPQQEAVDSAAVNQGRPAPETDRGVSLIGSGRFSGSNRKTVPVSRMIHFGGPMSGPVLAIHQEKQFAEAETGSGIYVAAQKQHLESLLSHEDYDYRLIVGHVGWKNEQLESELESGFWHIVPATPEAAFASSGDMWPNLIRRATSNSLAKWIGIPDQIGACELN